MGTENLQRRSPLCPWRERNESTSTGAQYSCRQDGFRTLTEVRCRPEHEAEAGSTVGIRLPEVGAYALDGGRLVIGLGPGWWMVDAPDGSAPVSGTAHVSAVDVSAQRTSLVMTGSSVRDVLAHGCSLDLHADIFAQGSAAQTILAKAGVILARTGTDEFRVWVRASFARYLAEWLLDASVEYR
jgi:sarcosine oxidase subunit gamma